MKKLLTVVTLTALFAIPLFAYGATFSQGPSVNLDQAQTINDNYYVAGGNLNLSGKMNQDVFAAGGNIIVSGAVGKDAAIAGGNIEITSAIGEDLRVAGGQISIEGPVKGELVAAGGQITVNAPINGTVTLAGQKITFGPNAVINSDVTYYSQTDATVATGAQIKGKLIRNETPYKAGMGDFRGGIRAAWGFALFVKLIMMIVAGLVLGLIWKKGSTNVVMHASSNFWKHLLYGLGFVILTPILFILLCITVVGLPLGILTMFLFGTAMVLGSIFAGIISGHLLYKYVFKMRDHGISWHMIVVGNIALYLIRLIPIIGWIVYAAIFLVAVGTKLTTTKRYLSTEM